MCVFRKTEEVAAYLGITSKSVNAHMLHTYAKMGIDIEDHEGSKLRMVAVYQWITYWMTEEAKATLRNARLTRQP